MQSGAHLWDRFGVVVLKEKKYAHVSAGIDILRIERNDFAEHRNGELRFLFLKIFLRLQFERSDFLLNVLAVLRH